MKRFIVLLLSTISLRTEASPQPRIQVYEIRKTNENRDVDTQYYDPDGSRKEDFIETMSKIHNKVNLKNIDKLIQLLSRHVKSQSMNKVNINNRFSSKFVNEYKKPDSDDDRLRREDITFGAKEDKSKDLSKLIQYLTRTDDDRNSDSIDMEDLTRSSPLVILSVDGAEQPQDLTALGKLLHSPLRSQHGVNEDRTAPPRVNRPYDDDY